MKREQFEAIKSHADEAFGVLPVEGRNLLVPRGLQGSYPLDEAAASKFTLIVIDQFESTSHKVTRLYTAKGEKVLVIPTSTDSDIRFSMSMEYLVGAVAFIGCDVYAPMIAQDFVDVLTYSKEFSDSGRGEIRLSTLLNDVCAYSNKVLFPYCDEAIRKLETNRAYGSHSVAIALAKTGVKRIALPKRVTETTATFDSKYVSTVLGNKVVVKDNEGQMLYIGDPKQFKCFGFKNLVIEEFIEGTERSISFTVSLDSAGDGFVLPLVQIEEANRLNTKPFGGPKFGDTLTFQRALTPSTVAEGFTELATSLMSNAREYYGTFDISFIVKGGISYITEMSTRFSNSNMSSILHMLGSPTDYLDIFRDRETCRPSDAVVFCSCRSSFGVSLLCLNKAARYDSITPMTLPTTQYIMGDGSLNTVAYCIDTDPIDAVFDYTFMNYLALDGRPCVCTVTTPSNPNDTLPSFQHLLPTLEAMNIFNTPIIADISGFSEFLDSSYACDG